MMSIVRQGKTICKNPVKRWARLTLTAWLTEPVWQPVRHESRLSFLRWQNRHLSWRKRQYERFRGQNNLLVHLGCGSYCLPGWVNLDSCPNEGVDLVGDVRDSLPFDTNSVKAIFMEHLLEHLRPYTEVPHLLAECLRTLEPNGRIRIVVPDGQYCLEAYASGNRWLPDRLNAFDWYIAHSEKGRTLSTIMEAVNELARQNGQHHFLYDFETIALRLREVGFCRMERSAVLDSSLPELRVDQQWRAEESLYVEAFR